MSGPVKVQYGRLALAVPASQAAPSDISTPKINYLPPTAGQAQSAWNSSGAFLDFTIPKSVGVLNNVKLRLQVTNNGGTNEPVLAPPTPFWVQQVEVYIGGTQIEVIYPNELFNEVVGFKTKEELDTDQAYLGATYESNSQSGQSLAIPVSGSGFNVQQYYYLPIPNCLTTCHLYVAGVTEDVRFRVYFPPQLFPTPQITCTSCTLVIEEDCCSNEEKIKYDEAHRDGIIYNTIVRQRQNQTLTKSGTADNTIELTGLSGACAALVSYAGPSVVPNFSSSSSDITRAGEAAGTYVQVPTNQLLYQRFVISTSLELDDAMGAKRTEELRTDDLASMTWYSHVGTNYAQRFPTYLVPLSSAARKAIEDGCNQGSMNLRGNDRLVVRGQPNTYSNGTTGPNPYSTAASEVWSFTVVNYCYQALVFKGRSLTNVIRKVNA